MMRFATIFLQVILNILGYFLPLKEVVYRPQFHHQLIPNKVMVESDFPTDLRECLESRGHVIENSEAYYAVVQEIHVVDGLIQATSDPRKGGIPDGY